MFTFPSIEIPLWILLIPYAVGILIFVIYGFFNIYHLLRFATYSFGSYVLVAFFLGGSLIICAATFMYLNTFDWTATWNPESFFNLKPNLKL